MSEVVVFTDCPGWHGEQLGAALAERGWRAVFVALADCSIRLDGNAPVVGIPGFGPEPPLAAFVRGVAAGTLEEVVLRLNVLHALKAAGTRVYNDGRAIERSVDKGLTSFLLADAGIPTPPTLVTAHRAEAEAFLKAELDAGHGVVSKPLFGSQGTDVVRLREVGELPAREAANGVWYLQRYVTGAGAHPEDWRLLVVGGRTVAAMRREGGWPANVACGAQCQAAVPTGDAAVLAERAVEALGMAYAGVDLLRDAAGGWWLIEVNSIPAWRGLQEVTEVSVAGLLVDDLLRGIAGPRPLEVV